MGIMKDIGMIVAVTPRSQAYLQMLVKNDLHPSHVIVMSDDEGKLYPGQMKKEKDSSPINPYREYFDLDEPLMETIRKEGISHEIIQTVDINCKLVVDTLCQRKEDAFVYSGFGGVILKDVLKAGKKIIHVHPGKVPEYRGSTTIYYSILRERKVWCTAFLMDEKIDNGPILKIKGYEPPADGRLVDYVYDPYIRADLLVNVIKDYLRVGEFRTVQQQENEDAETYFIIHPVLKHLAILSCEKG